MRFQVDQYGNAVKGAEYALYEATRTETNGEVSYEKKGTKLCSGSTSANGSLILKADDGATINFEELYKKDIGPYYILRETKAPDAIGRCGISGCITIRKPVLSRRKTSGIPGFMPIRES